MASYLTVVIGAIGFAASGYVGHHPTLAVIWLSVAAAGILSALSLFWSIPSSFLAGTSVAVGIAGINCVGNLAGFVSPYAVGWLNVMTHDNRAGLYFVAVCLVVAVFASILAIWEFTGTDALWRTVATCAAF